MSQADLERWEVKYAGRDVPRGVEPPEWLVRQADALPAGRALDVACGIGHAAIWLAQRGWDVTAVDISPTGISLAEQFAQQQGVFVHFVTSDLEDAEFGDEQYDLITVFRFLDRDKLPEKLMRALRPGGRLIYETFLNPPSEPTGGRPSNPAYLLSPGELPRLYAPLTVIAAEETPPPESVARLAARRPGA